MKLKKIISLITLMSIMLVSAVVPVHANDINTVRVNSVDGLLGAIASNTKIVVASGTYIIPSKTVTYGEYSYEEAQNINIPEGTQNLEIAADGYVEIALAVGTAPVVEIWRDARNITLTGLTLGHDVPEYSCEGEGHVLALYGCDDITVNNCDFYGCGILGISAHDAGDVIVNNTTIRECANGAGSFWWQKGNVTFNNCNFVGNAYDEWYAKYDPCFDFMASDELNGETKVAVFNNCNFTNNLNYECVVSESFPVEFNDCTFSNNYWETRIKIGVIKPALDPSQDGEYFPVEFYDQEPVIVDGRTLIPVRGLFESEWLNYSVEWVEEEKTAIISNDAMTVKITVGSNIIYKNGEPVTIDVPAQIINDRTMIPVRAISEAFDLDVNWDGDTRTVTVIAE